MPAAKFHLSSIYRLCQKKKYRSFLNY